MSSHRIQPSRITLSQEWLDTITKKKFMNLFVKLKTLKKQSNCRSPAWSYFGTLCQRNYASHEDSFTVLDDNFNYCCLCLKKQQQLLEKGDCMYDENLSKSLANSIKCYNVQTSTGTMNDHLLHEHTTEYLKNNKMNETCKTNGNEKKQLISECRTIAQDIQLLQDVLKQNPFTSTATWRDVAGAMNSATIEEVPFTGPFCKKRTNLLIDCHQKDDMKTLTSLSLPGTESEYLERQKLLQNLVDSVEENQEPENKRIKTENVELRLDVADNSDNSMDGIVHRESGESSDDTIVSEKVLTKTNTHRFKGTLSTKKGLAQKELEIREKELAFKEKQLLFQREQLQFEKERFAAEQKERVMRYSVEKEERDTRLKFESEERRNLMEILKTVLNKVKV